MMCRSHTQQRHWKTCSCESSAKTCPAIPGRTRVAARDTMSSDGTNRAVSSVHVECIIPILRVNNLQDSVRYYVDVLGFSIDWHDAPMASVSRDGRPIMLCEGEQGHAGTWVWIGVGDIQPLFDDFRAKGVKFRQLPTNRP